MFHPGMMSELLFLIKDFLVGSGSECMIYQILMKVINYRTAH